MRLSSLGWKNLLRGLMLVSGLCACSGGSDEVGPGNASGTVIYPGQTGTTGAAGGTGGTAQPTGGITTGSTTTTHTDTDGGTPSTTGGGTTTTGGTVDGGLPSGADGGGTGSTTGTTGTGKKPSDLPTPSGSCPPIAEGVQTFAGVEVTLHAVGPAGSPGPLMLYWHGTGSSPNEAKYGLGSNGVSDGPYLEEVRQSGGVVAAFSSGQTTGSNTSGNNVWNDADMAIADEVVACSIQAGHTDPARIHSLGMSAGGLQTTSFSYARSNYIASVVTYSGGHVVWNGIDISDTTAADPNNEFAAMIFHGGPSDVVGIAFQEGSESYRDTLQQRGHFAFICDHGDGHTIPRDAAASVWQFFQDHPYGTDPSPYAGGLPQGFPSYCSL